MRARSCANLGRESPEFEPTVRPPSGMARRSRSSIAIGMISSVVIVTPALGERLRGISTPSWNQNPRISTFLKAYTAVTSSSLSLLTTTNPSVKCVCKGIVSLSSLCMSRQST